MGPTPQEANWFAASSRASRAPRRVAENRCANVRTVTGTWPCGAVMGGSVAVSLGLRPGMTPTQFPLYQLTRWTGVVTARDDVRMGADNSEPEVSDNLKTFGAVLKALREEGGLTQEQFAPRVRYSVTYVAKMEQGRRFPPKELVPRVKDVLGAPAARVLGAAYRTLMRKAGLALWFQQWAGIEEEAVTLYAYECRAIPGLLQPEPYIRAIFDRRLPPVTEAQLEREVAARLERQRLLTERPNTAFSFIVEQAPLGAVCGCDQLAFRRLLIQMVAARRCSPAR
ncbi:xre family toxin-antitoxin system, antitoxin component [Streptomyces himastatinicus ATCC 53653]|uniref:Xre family toxin-antitoxin system, antitoxin component n=1 Tax=Streptomyces himastatinicus ATCC 53653 TaxID=457427 RepID=D9WM77_9ACTN|nr:xre family toxin-antitoxin system, antitoxin component [Streptomyces himastatinicus ATCC 53653]